MIYLGQGYLGKLHVSVQVRNSENWEEKGKWYHPTSVVEILERLGWELILTTPEYFGLQKVGEVDVIVEELKGLSIYELANIYPQTPTTWVIFSWRPWEEGYIYDLKRIEENWFKFAEEKRRIKRKNIGKLGSTVSKH